MRGGSVVRFICTAAACAAIAASFALSASAGHRDAATRAATSGVLIPSSPGEILPLSGGTVHSANWSGYAVRSKQHAISGVSGTFVVPSITKRRFGIAATWAGVGGFKTKDLVQAGTVEESQFGRRYFAWYELLPAGLVHLHGCHGDPHCNVSPGDHISVSISNVSGNSWKIAVGNAGHWSWTRQFAYTSSRSSADWILEAPSNGVETYPLAHVGTVSFGPTSKYTASGASHTIAQGHPVRIILRGGQATPSALGSDRQSFDDCSYQTSCPRP
jgi:hypothetical protein